MALSDPQVSDYVQYNGDLPEEWDRTGRILAVEDDASGDKIVTVLLDSGQQQDILASELDYPADDGAEYALRAASTDRHKEKPLSIRLGSLREQVEQRAAESGIPVRRFILEAVAEKLDEAAAPTREENRQAIADAEQRILEKITRQPGGSQWEYVSGDWREQRALKNLFRDGKVHYGANLSARYNIYPTAR